MSDHPFCPHCGFNFTRDETVERDGWRLDPSTGVAHYKGKRVRMSVTHCELLRSFAASRRPLTRDALLGRVSDSADNKIIDVQLCRLRAVLREQEVPVPFEKAGGYGTGWIWQVAE